MTTSSSDTAFRLRRCPRLVAAHPLRVGPPAPQTAKITFCVRGVIGIPRGARARHFVFSAQPLAEPPTGVSFHRSVGFADRTEAEVVGPSDYQSIKAYHYRLYVPLRLAPSGRLANRRTDALYALLRRRGAQIGPSRLRRVTAPKRVTQKVELLFRQLADPRLAIVHRQPGPLHHVPHSGEGLFSPATAADHKIIGGVDDARFQTLLVSQLLPAEHEPAHV